MEQTVAQERMMNYYHKKDCMRIYIIVNFQKEE